MIVVPEAEEALTRGAYDAVADVYADRFKATEPEQPLELAMIDHFARLCPEPRRVLDAGCGSGRMLPYLAAKGCRPEGVDLSTEMIRRAMSDHPEYPSTVGSLTGLKHSDEEFNGVFSWYSTIHNPNEDIDRMIAEMVRVLHPGGYLLVAFQTGEGMRRVGDGFAALGHDVVMNRYHRPIDRMMAQIVSHDLEIAAQMERAPIAAEADPQAVIIARRPQPS